MARNAKTRCARHRGSRFVVTSALVAADRLDEKGIVNFAGGIPKEFLTGTAITIILALLILSVRARPGGSIVSGWFGRCLVSDHRLLGGSDCGSGRGSRM